MLVQSVNQFDGENIEMFCLRMSERKNSENNFLFLPQMIQEDELSGGIQQSCRLQHSCWGAQAGSAQASGVSGSIEGHSHWGASPAQKMYSLIPPNMLCQRK